MNKTVTVKAGNGCTATLIHGDSSEAVVGLTGVDAVITDPPYEIKHLGGGGCFQDSNPKVFLADTALNDIVDSYDIKQAMKLWLDTGAKNILVFCSNPQIEKTLEAMREEELNSTVMVWWKHNAAPMVNNTWWPDAEYMIHGGHGNPWQPDVEYMIHGRIKKAYMNNDVDPELKRRVRKRPMVSAEEFNGLGKNLHPTAKPVALCQELIEVLCPPGGVVLDPFMGSGAVGVAALRAGRSYIGIERQPTPPYNYGYFDLAVNRITKEASQKTMF